MEFISRCGSAAQHKRFGVSLKDIAHIHVWSWWIISYLFFGGFSRESFVKTCETRNSISIDQEGFDTWKNMSKEVKVLGISD